MPGRPRRRRSCWARGEVFKAQLPGSSEAAIEWLQHDGPRRIWIGVYSENHGAQRFYQRRGWRKVGEYHFPVGTVRDLEWILRKDCA